MVRLTLHLAVLCVVMSAIIVMVGIQLGAQRDTTQIVYYTDRAALATYDADHNVHQPLLHLDNIEEIFNLNWSPGGSYLSFMTLNRSTYTLMLFHPASRRLDVITADFLDPFNSLSWSPDGGQAVFAEDGQACLLQLSNLERRCERNTIPVSALRWSPNGKEILALSHMANSDALTILNTNLQVERQITLNPMPIDTFVQWSHSGRYLVYLAEAGLTCCEWYAVEADATDQPSRLVYSNLQDDKVSISTRRDALLILRTERTPSSTTVTRVYERSLVDGNEEWLLQMGGSGSSSITYEQFAWAPDGRTFGWSTAANSQQTRVDLFISNRERSIRARTPYFAWRP